MAEFASKGVAGAGLGLGIAGTALGVLNSGGLGGILGGLGGWGNGAALAGGTALGVLAEKDAKIAELTAEKYSDGIGKDVYSQSLADNKAVREELYAFIKPLAEEAANNRVNIARLEEQQKCCCEKQELREQIMEGKIREQGLVLGGKIDQVASAAKCCCEQNSAAIAGLQALMSKITQTVIPTSAICPEVMPRYNSWTAPTTPATATTSPTA